MSLLSRYLLGTLAAVAFALGVIATPALADACPNAQYRVAASASLPDCRAYEQVSPVDKNGNTVGALDAPPRGDGNAVAFNSQGAFAGSASSLNGNYLATRSPTGWQTAALNPPTSGPVGGAYNQFVSSDFSTDLSETLFSTTYPVSANDQTPGNGGGTGTQTTNLDLYLRSAAGSLTWVSTANPDVPDSNGGQAALGGASADLSKIFFQTTEPLTAEAQGSSAQNIYEWQAGALHAVNVDASGGLLPGGAGVGNNTAQASPDYNLGDWGQAADPTAVSPDGSTVFFTSPLTGVKQVWVWVNGKTTEVSVSQATATAGQPAPDGAEFLVADSTGSTMLFYSEDQLTNSAPAGGGIYSYQVASSQLSFLTPLPTEKTGANANTGGLLAVSPDLSYLYLCNNGTGIELFHAGSVQPVAAASCNASGGTVSPNVPANGPVSTPDSGYVFTSATATSSVIPGSTYNNNGDQEVYLYSASADSVVCVSCRPDGTPSEGNADVTVTSGARDLTDDGGRVFFETTDQLVPQDTNDAKDVYEFESAGVGSCQASAGCLYLISSGTDPNGSTLEGISSNGDDVFFITDQGLVSQDTDGGSDLYDARVDGGFPAQLAAVPCQSSNQCEGPSSGPPLVPNIGTVSLTGPENPVSKAVKTAPKVTGKVTASKHVIRTVIKDTAFVLTARIPAKGKITVTGPQVKRLIRKSSKAGSVKLTVHLSNRAAKRLKQEKARLKKRPRRIKGKQVVAELNLRVKVAYTPASGKASSVITTVTVKA